MKWHFRLLGYQGSVNLFFIKMGQPRPLFRLFRSFQTNIITIFTTKICEKSKCPSSIRCWDSKPRPLERESLPITTKAGLPPRAQSILGQVHAWQRIEFAQKIAASGPSRNKNINWQSLWVSWESGRFCVQRSAVWIQSLAKFDIEHLFVNCLLYWKDENNEKVAGNGPLKRNCWAEITKERILINPCWRPGNHFFKRVITFEEISPWMTHFILTGACT